jgi:hypothetical protein
MHEKSIKLLYFPMSIKWLLEEAIPPTLFNESRKLAVG